MYTYIHIYIHMYESAKTTRASSVIRSRSPPLCLHIEWLLEFNQRSHLIWGPKFTMP